MSVTLLRNYGTFLSGAVITLDADSETALIAQGIGTAFTGGIAANSRVGAPDMYGTQGGNQYNFAQAGLTSTVGSYQGSLILPCISLGSVALSTYETAGVAPVSGTMNLTEIYVPYVNTWTGIGVLNGTTVGTNNHLIALYGSNGTLLANSAVAGTVTANASTMQNRAFTSPITLVPGRYFLGVQANGVTDTLRHLLAANGANICTSATAGVFGTVPATLTPPATFTTAVGVIAQLYT